RSPRFSMMNEKLDWTGQLGEAFLAQPDDVQNAVQALRKQAEKPGNLKARKTQVRGRGVAPRRQGYWGPPEYFVIEPVEPQYVYVPVYDPVVVYGPGYWPPAYVPFFWHPPWWTVGPAFASAQRSSSARHCGTTTIGGTADLRRSRQTPCSTANSTR